VLAAMIASAATMTLLQKIVIRGPDMRDSNSELNLTIWLGIDIASGSLPPGIATSLLMWIFG
jgi:hypothetical protein